MDFLAWRRAQAFSQELMVTTYWSDGLTEKKQRLRSFGATFSGVVWTILSCTSLRKLRVLHSVRSTAAQPCPSRPLSARLCPCVLSGRGLYRRSSECALVARVRDVEVEESFRMRRDFDKLCYGKEGSSAMRGWV